MKQKTFSFVFVLWLLSLAKSQQWGSYRDLTFNYLGRKKLNKFLALSLSIIITIKDNKDLLWDNQHSSYSLVGSRMCVLSIENAEGHASVTSAISEHIWKYNTIGNGIVKYAGSWRINMEVVWKVKARMEE